MSTWLCHKVPKLLAKHLFWVCLWECFWMILRFECADWIKQNALPNVGGPHLINWRSEKNKKSELKRNSSCLTVYARTLVFSELQAQHWPFLGLKPPGFWTGTYAIISFLVLKALDSDWKYTMGSPGSPPCLQQVSGLLSFYNHVSQFLIINHRW